MQFTNVYLYFVQLLYKDVHQCVLVFRTTTLQRRSPVCTCILYNYFTKTFTSVYLYFVQLLYKDVRMNFSILLVGLRSRAVTVSGRGHSSSTMMWSKWSWCPQTSTVTTISSRSAQIVPCRLCECAC